MTDKTGNNLRIRAVIVSFLNNCFVFTLTYKHPLDNQHVNPQLSLFPLGDAAKHQRAIGEHLWWQVSY